jgi:hypothetical protein
MRKISLLLIFSVVINSVAQDANLHYRYNPKIDPLENHAPLPPIREKRIFEERLKITRMLEQLSGRVDGNLSASNGSAMTDLATRTTQFIQAQRAITTEINAKQRAENPSAPPLVHIITAVPSTSVTTAKTPDVLSKASPQIQDLAANLEKASGNNEERWAHLESVWKVAQNGYKGVPEADRAALEQIYETYFDSEGLLNEAALGKEGGELTRNLGDGLNISQKSSQGKHIRRAINAGVSLATGPDEDGRVRGIGAITMSLGADAAYAEGDQKAGKFLLKAADTILGFIPLVSSANDLANIISGMATGYDFTGERMTAGDYALRSLGIVVGLIPAGGAIARTVGNGLKFGGQFLTRQFVKGALLVRLSGEGQQIARNVASLKSRVEVVTELGSLGATQAAIVKGLARHPEQLNTAKVFDGVIEASTRAPNLMEKIAVESPSELGHYAELVNESSAIKFTDEKFEIVQEMSREALDARRLINSGARTLYRTGKYGASKNNNSRIGEKVEGSIYWSMENPLTTKNFGDRYGIYSEGNDWVEIGTLREKVPFVTRKAPPGAYKKDGNLITTSGGGIEIVTPKGNVINTRHIPTR